MDQNPTIVDEIQSLLAAPAAGERRPSLALMEHTLTSGYARALALEAEAWRLEQRIGEVMSAEGADDESEAAIRARELEALARRRTTAEYDLSHLRNLLSTLRTRASDLRAVGGA